MKTLEPTSKNKLKEIIDTAKKGYPYEIIQTYLNNDTIQDYFIIDHSGISTALFFDGKTNNEIPSNGVNVPWSRPGVELKYKVINLLCEDRQNEILVRGGSGGTEGLNLTTEIYRFDSTLGIMKLVFQKDELVSHHEKNGKDVIDETNYVGLSYDDSCNIEIYVCKGVYKNDTVAPLKDAKKTIYHFNELANQFEISASKQVSFITTFDIKNATKDGFYLNGYVVNINYEDGKKYNGKKIQVSGKVEIIKGITNTPGVPPKQGRTSDYKYIDKPVIKIVSKTTAN